MVGGIITVIAEDTKAWFAGHIDVVVYLYDAETKAQAR